MSSLQARSFRWVRRPLEYLFTWLGLAYLGILLLGASLALWFSLLVVPRARHRAFTQASIARLFRIYLGTLKTLGWLKLDLSQLKVLESQGPLLVAPNHPCLIDAVLMLSYMPRAVCLMKPALMSNPLYGFGARMAGYVSNEQPVPMVRRIREAKQLGEQLLIFPEGTRTVRPPVNQVSGVFSLIARCADMPIQIVFIETDSDFLGKHWPLWKAPHLPVSYRAVVGPVVTPDAHTRDIKSHVQQLYETHFQAAARSVAQKELLDDGLLSKHPR